MNTLTIALLQMERVPPGEGPVAAMRKGEEFCRRAAAQGADIALFPEMWNIGYEFFDPAAEGAREAWFERAVGRDSEYVARFRGLARELDMAIAVTYLEEWPGLPRNTVSLIDRHGEIVLTYAKVHTCDFDVECNLTPGDDFYVCRLDTRLGPVSVGAMICYDREFPESARVLMLKGAEVILVPNSCEMEENRTGQLRARALENMAAVALANYAGPRDRGHSVAFHPMGFNSENEASVDTLVVRAGENEGIFMAAFDMDALRAWREHETWGNSYRKPRAYAALVSNDVQPPFVRGDSRR